MSADASLGVSSRPYWAVETPLRGRITPGDSPYRRVMDPHRLLPYSPMSSGQSSPEGVRGSREFRFRTRSRSLSPQGRNLFSPYGVGHIPLHMSHTAVDSEVSSIASCGSRKSSVEAEGSGQNPDYTLTIEGLGRRMYRGANGQNGGMKTGDWRDEREGLVMEILECQRRIQSISQEALDWELSKQEYDQKIQKLQQQLDDANTTRVACNKLKLQKWSKKKSSVWDIRGPTSPHERLDDAHELIQAFVESERQYTNNLTALDTQYQQPMKMLSAYKPDILPLQQLQSLFLNCSELLNLHRYLFEELDRLQCLPQSIQLDQFFSILERIFPCFSLYNPFLDCSRQQNIQKELRMMRQKQEFVQLLDHCDKKCEGGNLEKLLLLPCERLNDYSTLLTMFLSPKVRDIADESVRRADTLIRFIRTMKYELQDERSDWDHALEKIKLLQKLDPDFPVPLEIFDSNTRLVKQGQLNQVMAGDKEVPRFCFLFSNYMALAEADKYLRILEHGMIPLCGAQLHKTVDIEGQPLEPDLKSGRLEDRLAFRVSFVNNESLYFRVAKPSLWKTWVEALEMCIQQSHQEQYDAEDVLPTQLYPDVGPKIAAASLEKLFQQLTSPHNFQDDFMEVFLMTHLSFTTSSDVLVALINCMQCPRSLSDMAGHLSANAVFTFSMESESVESERLSSIVPYSDNDQMLMNSPLPTRHRTNAMASSSPNKGSSMRASISTSDSDVSPHTSAIVDGGILQNGWSNEVSLKIPPGNKRTSSGDSEADYVLFFRRSRNSSELEFGDNEDSGNEDNADTPKPSVSDSIVSAARARDRTKATQQQSLGELGEVRAEVEQGKITETSIEEEEEEEEGSDKKGGGEGGRFEEGEGELELSHSQRMNRELDAASSMLEKVTESLFAMEEVAPATGPRGRRSQLYSDRDDNHSPVVNGHETAEPAGEAVEVEKREQKDWQQSRHSTMSASISEPDLTQIGVSESPTPEVKRICTQISIPVPTPASHRPGTPTDRLTNSLSRRQNYSASQSPFLHGKAMMSPTHKKNFSVGMGSPVHHSGDDRFTSSGKYKRGSGNSERSVMSRFKKHSSGKSESVKIESHKKAEPSPVPSRFGNRIPALTKSSSAYFPNAVEHTTSKPHKSRGSSGGGLKGIWKRTSRKKTSVKYEGEEGVDGGAAVEQSPTHELPRRLSLRRMNSISGDKHVASQLEPLTERTKSPLHPRRTGSTNRGGPISLVTKIFQVLDYWQDMHFEDFGEDQGLRQRLEDFLHGLVARNCSDSKEALLGQKLLDDVMRKGSLYSTDCSFPALLSRIYQLDPDVVKHFTWNTPQKQLVVSRDIDLGRSISKDSKDNMLKVIAEQMTLMEFAVYKAVKRRELLNVNWKKPNREESAPNVCRLIQRTNEMTSWVCTEILMRDSPSSRATVIEHFVQIALYCYRHNDQHCSLNITIALSSSIIRGLRKSWEEVDKKYRDKFKKLRELTDYQGRCKKLRERLEQTTMDHLHKTGEIPPALPYIGAYLDQIYSLEMCTKTYNKDDLVNFTKMTKLADLVGRTLVYQKTRFKFDPRLDIIAYLTSAKRVSENELYELSCQIEPTTSRP